MIPATSPAAIERLASHLAGSSRILVFTGAGISTASGIPDYRGPQGVWKTQRPVFYQDFMASADARRHYWRQKLENRRLHGDAAPNVVHEAIVRLDASGSVEMVVTQNVDGLHAASGLPVERLVEVHGTARLVECQACGERSDPAPHFAAFAADEKPPVCHCGGHLKPATISFGQNLRPGDLERAFGAAAAADLVVVLGSTLSVTPAASIPLAAAEHGARYVIVNRGPTDHDHLRLVDLRIDGDVAEAFPPAVDAALGGSPHG